MQITRKQNRIVNKMIIYWSENGYLSSDQRDRLVSSYKVMGFDWKRLAAYSFWLAIICTLIAVNALLMDDMFIRLLATLFTAPDIVKSVAGAVVAAVIFWFGFRRRDTSPYKTFSNEAILFLGVVAVALSVFYLGKVIDNGSGRISLLFLLATVVYGLIGFRYRSVLIWIFALLSFSNWFGTETGYLSGWGAYFLGMNYPLRFVLFGSVLVGISFLFRRNDRTSYLFKATYVIALLHLFIALWLMSLFGNHGGEASRPELFGHSCFFGLVAIGFIIQGLRHEDTIAKGFGLTFLMINLYTKYFEYFWDSTHKAIFFTVLAVSFWLIGLKAEVVWNLSMDNVSRLVDLKKRTKPGEQQESPAAD